MNEDLDKLLLDFSATQLDPGAVTRAIRYLLEREKERQDADEADYQRRMME